jgi:putative ABC transport system ATP-binding protein
MLLEVNNLTKYYERRNCEIRAVDHVNFTADKGTFYSIIGKSGSGKSTFLNLLAGFITPDKGTVHWNGNNVHEFSDKAASVFRNQSIGCILQNDSVLGNLSVIENVMLPAEIYGNRRDSYKRALELLHLVGIAELADCYPKDLSGGELRRVAIARALINEPEMILADEPTGDLDYENTMIIIEIFRKITAQGTTVLMVTHDMNTIRYSDAIYQMNDGKLTVFDNLGKNIC